MPSAVVETVAWLAFVLAAGALVSAVLLVRELRALSRAHTDRKWEIQGLRADLVALRRHAVAERTEAHPGAAGAAGDTGGDGASGAEGAPTTEGASGTEGVPGEQGSPGAGEGAPVVEGARSARPSLSSPTAWRRRRGRTAARAPRRRPGG